MSPFLHVFFTESICIQVSCTRFDSFWCNDKHQYVLIGVHANGTGTTVIRRLSAWNHGGGRFNRNVSEEKSISTLQQ